MAGPLNKGTQRSDTQALLEVSEARLRAIVDTAPDGIVVANSNGDIIQVNRSAEQMFGYPPAELLGRPVTVLMPERFHVAYRAGLAHFLTTGEARLIGRITELAGLRKDGREFPVELSLATSETLDGQIFSGILRDTSWRRQAERELVEKRVQLEATNKELEAFSYSVSHDLRAPLRSIQGFSQVLLEDCYDQLNEHGRDAVGRITAAIKRMERLIDALLALARVTRSEVHHDLVDLSALAHAVAGDLHRQEPKRPVRFVIQPDLAADGDAALLRVVIENLFSNAWKATARRARGRIEFGVRHEDGRRAFFVRDNGMGFDSTYTHKLFTAFQSLHRRMDFPGTGIGLATVQRIVSKHGGAVWAVGALDHGAVFYFTL